MLVIRLFLLTVLLLTGTTPLAQSSEENEKIVVVNSKSWPPFSFVGDNGESKGILYDLWMEVARQQEIDIQFVNTDWADTLDKIRSGDADLHAGLFRSSERDEYMDFSVPIDIPIATRLFVASDLDVEKLYEMGEHQVGVTKGGFAEGFIEANYPEVLIKSYPNSKEIIEAAIQREIKVFAMDYPTGMYFLHKHGYPTEFRAVETLYMERLRAGVPEGNRELLKLANKALTEMPEEEFNRILSKWIQSDKALPRWILPGFLFSVAFLLFSFTVFYILMLRKQVDAKTQELRTLSEIDALTKISNRQKFETCFECELTRYKRYKQVFSLILIDIDDFKLVNDIHGHSVGDEVLISLVDLLKTNIRESDMIARWGGEEFVILCPNTDKNSATQQAIKLQELILSHEFPVVDRCTVSFGIAEVTESDDTQDVFIRADKALYTSKEEGKNTVTS
ncbi:sensor domain-containing diguanylate cyclase [Vibrio hannami]|uniref:transporter substrate-binding domain-containing diguanylate cyclase n=1 Tax=Vibrio hannami TaxID=2717094 RepID=UPI00240ED978|nr:sensor domain-containing diguanylate cyclase [Vibrio hannami]MDG3088363.1 sensor domain-containing diguanylate cyclase [Vibrio hannami]